VNKTAIKRKEIKQNMQIIMMIRYIENIVSYRQKKNIGFFDISWYLLYIIIFLIYCNILCQKFIFLLLHYQN